MTKEIFSFSFMVNHGTSYISLICIDTKGKDTEITRSL